MSGTSDIFKSPTEIRERELQRRKDIVTELQNLPVPEGSKAYDIICEASSMSRVSCSSRQHNSHSSSS